MPWKASHCLPLVVTVRPGTWHAFEYCEEAGCLWSVDSSIRNGVEEEMEKTQGHLMTAFNIGGFV